MKPKPFSSLNHFTVPVAISHLPPSSTVVPAKNVPPIPRRTPTARNAFVPHPAALRAGVSGGSAPQFGGHARELFGPRLLGPNGELQRVVRVARYRVDVEVEDRL